MAYIGVSPSNGVRRVHTYTATASQTTFSGAGAEGTSLSYKDSNFVDVYQNGVKLGDADYTATSGTSIVLGTGATASDLVVIVVFDVFSVADTVSKANGGTFDGAVTFAGGITDSGDLTVDVAGDITLDADGSQVIFADGGTNMGEITNDGSSNFVIKSLVQDKDIIFKGNDGGSIITALTLDMSEAGQATFNSSITVADTVAIASSNTNAFIQCSNNVFQIGTSSSDPFTFIADNSERMRITSDGDLFLGTSSANSAGKIDVEFNGSSRNGIVLKTTRVATGTNFMEFVNSSGSSAGTINHNGSTTVSYNTSSDYRLKENVSYNFDATTRLKQLKPARFNFIADGADKIVDGFLAHEVSNIVPEAITGEKDATKEDGSIKAQGIDQSKLVPLLTKTLQEALTRIDTLEAEVKTLKGE